MEGINDYGSMLKTMGKQDSLTLVEKSHYMEEKPA